MSPISDPKKRQDILFYSKKIRTLHTIVFPLKLILLGLSVTWLVDCSPEKLIHLKIHSGGGRNNLMYTYSSEAPPPNGYAYNFYHIPLPSLLTFLHSNSKSVTFPFLPLSPPFLSSCPSLWNHPKVQACFPRHSGLSEYFSEDALHQSTFFNSL